MKNSTFSRRGPDYITEELLEALSKKAALDFKALFDVIFAKLITRNAAKGGQEMLRLRAYERLQNLVRQGVAKKVDGKYRGAQPALDKLREEMKGVEGGAPAAVPAKAPAAKTKSASSKAATTASRPAAKQRVGAAL